MLKPFHWGHIVFLAALSFLTFLIYSNSYSVPLVFDDYRFVPPDFPNIANESFISWKLFWAGSGWFLPSTVFGTPSYDRIIPFFTLALNYRLGGLNVEGYHFVNIVIHLSNGFLLYILAIMLYRHYRLISDQRLQMGCAFGAALLFCSHPISVQVATYISQRMLSLCVLFYLASIICFIKGRQLSEENTSHPIWRPILYVCAVWFGLCALKSKEAAVTLPGVILLLELCLYPNSRFSWRRRISWMVGLFLGFFLFMLWHLHLLELEGDALLRQLTAIRQQADNYSRLEYFLTQCRVIMTYLRFLLAPYPLHLDHFYTVSNSLFEIATFASFSCLILLIWGGVVAWPRRPWLSLMIFFWFGTLAPSSGLFPTSELMFEYRMYLPATLFWIFFPCFLVSLPKLTSPYKCFKLLPLKRISSDLWVKKIVPTLILGWTTIFSIQTYAYNEVFKDPVTLWDDSIKKSPLKERPYLNRGLGYELKGEFKEAIADYNKAIALKPSYGDAYFNRANSYRELGRYDLAIEDYKKLTNLRPDFSESYNNLGLTYYKREEYKQAIVSYTSGLVVSPNHYKMYNNRGLSLVELKRYDEALSDYNRAIDLAPSYGAAHYNRANIYNALKRYEEAISGHSTAIKLDKNHTNARINRGLAYWFTGRRTNACEDWKVACQLGDCEPYEQAQKRQNCE